MGKERHSEVETRGHGDTKKREGRRSGGADSQPSSFPAFSVPLWFFRCDGGILAYELPVTGRSITSFEDMAVG